MTKRETRREVGNQNRGEGGEEREERDSTPCSEQKIQNSFHVCEITSRLGGGVNYTYIGNNNSPRLSQQLKSPR